MRMRTNRMLWTAGIAAAIAGAAGFAATAEPAPCGPRGGLMRGAGTFLARLKATDGQKTQIADLLAARKEPLRRAIAGAVEARRALEAAVRAETFDETAVRAAARAASAAQEELAVERARLAAALHPVFDAGQKAAIGEAMKTVGARLADRWKNAGASLHAWVDEHRTK